MDSQKQLHSAILMACGGKAIDVKGTDRTTLSKMSKNKGNITLKTLSSISKANNIPMSICIETENGTLKVKI